MPLHRTLLIRSLALLLTRSSKLERLVQSTEGFVERLALSALSDEELGALTDACYRGAPKSERRALFEWERAWLERDLPAPPSRVLLGGAGYGPELTWLEARGHEVIAFDPVARPGGHVIVARYEDLIAPPPHGEAAGRILAGAPYAAALFGWGSLTHVAGDENRRALLHVMRRLCEGPVLVSYWARAEQIEQRGGRAAALAEHIARWLGPRIDAARHHDRVSAHAGYGHRFSSAEIEALAARAGYRARVHPDGYAHATLTPT